MAARDFSAGCGGNGGHALEGRRFLRLGLMTISTMTVSGFISGTALYVQLFAEAGIGESLCTNGEHLCDNQFVFVSKSFSSAGFLTTILILVQGLLFDRVGGNVLSTAGACLVILGFLVLQIPLVGAWSGYDAQTRGWLTPAIIISDTGASLNGFGILSILYHFPDLPTFISCLVASTSVMPAALPAVLSILIESTGFLLWPMMLGWLVFVTLAGVCCHYTVPTLAEYRAQAEKVLGMPLPIAGATSVWRLLLDGHAVMRPHWRTHVATIISMAAAVNILTLYTTLLGDLGVVLFNDKDAGHHLGMIFTVLLSVAGTIFAPLATYIGDQVGSGTQILMALCILLNLITSICIVKPTWPAQIATCTSSGLFSALYGSVIMKYCVAYATPTRLGVFQGLITAYMGLTMGLFLALSYAWMAALPTDQPVHVILPLQALSILATVLIVAWSLSVLCLGLPKVPVILAKDEEELSQAFGCANLGEVMQVTGIADRTQLLTRLTSPDALQELVAASRARSGPSSDPHGSDSSFAAPPGNPRLASS